MVPCHEVVNVSSLGLEGINSRISRGNSLRSIKWFLGFGFWGVVLHSFFGRRSSDSHQGQRICHRQTTEKIRAIRKDTRQSLNMRFIVKVPGWPWCHICNLDEHIGFLYGDPRVKSFFQSGIDQVLSVSLSRWEIGSCEPGVLLHVLTTGQAFLRRHELIVCSAVLLTFAFAWCNKALLFFPLLRFGSDMQWSLAVAQLWDVYPLSKFLRDFRIGEEFLKSWRQCAASSVPSGQHRPENVQNSHLSLWLAFSFHADEGRTGEHPSVEVLLDLLQGSRGYATFWFRWYSLIESSVD